MFSNSKKITISELGELRSINKLVRQQDFLFSVVAENSYFVHKGQQWLKTQGDVVKLLKQKQLQKKVQLEKKWLHKKILMNLSKEKVLFKTLTKIALTIT